MVSAGAKDVWRAVIDDAGVILLRNFDRVERNFRLMRCGSREGIDGQDVNILIAPSPNGTYLEILMPWGRGARADRRMWIRREVRRDTKATRRAELRQKKGGVVLVGGRRGKQRQRRVRISEREVSAKKRA